MTYTPANSITIITPGNYEITYNTTLSASLGAAVTMSVRQNGTNIPSATISRTLSVGVGSLFSGNTVVALAAGDVIDLAVQALIAVGITLGSGTNAVLTVKKLN